MKVVTCCVTGIIMYLKIKKGKNEMSKVEFGIKKLKATSACTKRLIKGTKRSSEDCLEAEEDIRDIWFGDAWFAGVDSAVEVSEYGKFVGVVKTNSAMYPKTYLEGVMKNWPAGSHLVLQTI